MQSTIKGAPSFAYIDVVLEPGDSIIAEAGAMSSMDSGLEISTVFNGGFFSAIFKRVFGRESLFINTFKNVTQEAKKLVLVQNTPGEVKELPLDKDGICLQPGTYVASTPGLKLSVRWAGFRSWFAKEGLFKLFVFGTGTLWFGAYGGILFKKVNGVFCVDTSHLVAYQPHMKLKLQMAGGMFSSLFGGEGFVTRVEGKGMVAVQTRSIEGLASWVNSKLI